MFRKKRQPPIRSLVGEGARFVGDLEFSDGLRIDGEVVGNVTATNEHGNLLVISEKARIVGKVKAGHVIINGEVLGPVESGELLEIQPRARVYGDVRYLMLEMHAGACVEGDLRPLKPEERPTLTLAASNPS